MTEKVKSGSEGSGSVGGNNTTTTTTSLWESILSSSLSKSSTVPLRNPTILVVGDSQSGKRSLVNSILNSFSANNPNTTSNPSVPLLYNYFDLHLTPDPDDIPLCTVDLWTLDSNNANHLTFLENLLSDLSKFDPSFSSSSSSTDAASSTSNSNLTPLIILICIDLSTPHNCPSSLSSWLQLLRTHLPLLSPSSSASNSFNPLLSHWLSYSEVASTPSSSSSSSSSSSTSTSGSSTSISNPSTLQTILAESGIQTDASTLPFPVFVVGTKSDSLHLKHDENLLLSTTLRLIALQHASTLLYTSSKRSTNIQLLRSYLSHWIFKFFNYNASNHTASQQNSNLATTPNTSLTSDQNLFVPFGWDSNAKILTETVSSYPKVTSVDEILPLFSSIITPPKDSSHTSNTSTLAMLTNLSSSVNEVHAEEDNQFLTRQYEALNASPSSSNPESSPQKLITGNVSSTSSTAGGVGAGATANTGVDKNAFVTPTRNRATGATGAVGGVGVSSGRKVVAGSPVTEDKNEHKVLADFFTSLMTGARRTPSGSTTASGTSNTTTSPSATKNKDDK